MSKIVLRLVLAALLTGVAGCAPAPDFVRVEDGRFIRHGKPYRYVGTNFWYGPILASDGRGGDPGRLARELDTLKALGLENLRVLVGADGADGVFSRVEPTLQVSPGVYNDTLLVGLDRLLVELGKRDMQAVLYLNNTWEWSGGYGQYLEWATGERALIPALDGYQEFMEQMSGFQTSAEAQELFFNHVRAIVGRTNSVTGKPYRDDPAIFSWQIGNEPRCFSADPAVRARFIDWIAEAARIIKEIDPNHLVSTGNEGLFGCEQDPALLDEMAGIPGVDYMTIHIWPYNWEWVRSDHLEADLASALIKTDAYIGAHTKLAAQRGLPLVAEEFGFPRDGFSESRDATTTCRDRYYAHIFGRVIDGTLDGANFWGWSGFARPSHSRWERGDDYAGDPAQEPQGLNGVYVTDATLSVIRQSTEALSASSASRPESTPKQRYLSRLSDVASAGKILYGHQDDLSYGHAWCVTDWRDDGLTRSDIRDVSGRYPAIVGFDLGGIEKGDATNLDGVPFGLMRKAAMLHACRGGIVTFSWHPRNPLTGGDAWDISSAEAVRSVLEGGPLHETFLEWLDRAAAFLQSLGEIPIIFRPWHENIGTWFWWGGDLCTAEEYIALFRLTRERFEARGLWNLLWCYSPNGPVPEADYLSRYPGDAFVDLLGTDIYEYPGGGNLKAAGAHFSAQVKEMLGTLRELAAQRGKLSCLSETGLEGLPDPHWWTGALYPAIAGSGSCYVLTWRNAHDKPGHFYAPWKGFANAGDFVAFSEMETIVLL